MFFSFLVKNILIGLISLLVLNTSECISFAFLGRTIYQRAKPRLRNMGNTYRETDPYVENSQRRNQRAFQARRQGKSNKSS